MTISGSSDEDCTMGPVRIRHSSHHFGWQSSHSVDRAGWQAKMASIEFWIPWRNAHKHNSRPNKRLSMLWRFSKQSFVIKHCPHSSGHEMDSWKISWVTNFHIQHQVMGKQKSSLFWVSWVFQLSDKQTYFHIIWKFAKFIPIIQTFHKYYRILCNALSYEN